MVDVHSLSQDVYFFKFMELWQVCQSNRDSILSISIFFSVSCVSAFRSQALRDTALQLEWVYLVADRGGSSFTFQELNFLKYLELWQVCQSWRDPTFSNSFWVCQVCQPPDHRPSEVRHYSLKELTQCNIGCMFTFPGLNFLKYLVLWQGCQSWRYLTFFKFFSSVSGVSASRSQALRGTAFQLEQVNSVSDRVDSFTFPEYILFEIDGTVARVSV